MKAFERKELETTVAGWGTDLALEMRPGVPREAVEPLENGAHWSKPESQMPTVKVFHSIERPGLTPVFGTTCPPKGLSGIIRARAYQMGEHFVSRWMLLIAADRIDMVESRVGELVFGRDTNPLTERRRRGALVLGGFALTAVLGTLAYRRYRASPKVGR